MQQQPHRLSVDGCKSLDTQNIVGACHILRPRGEVAGRREYREVDDERLEVVVIVLGYVIVMRRPAREIVFSGGRKAEQYARRNTALLDCDDFDGARHASLDLVRKQGGFFSRHQVGLVEHDEIGAKQLIFVNLFKRVVVIDGRIRGALRCNFRGVIGKAAGPDGRPVDDRDDAVDGDAIADIRPLEGFDERLGKREARRFDDDVIRRGPARQQRFESRHEIVGDGAAKATVRQLDDIFFRAALDAARAQDGAVHADVAELIDDERQAPALRVFERMTDQRRLSGTEKSGDDRDGHFTRGHPAGSKS